MKWVQRKIPGGNLVFTNRDEAKKARGEQNEEVMGNKNKGPGWRATIHMTFRDRRIDVWY